MNEKTDNLPIKTQNLGHFFGTGEARKQVLFDINLEFKAGELTILMGASGSGKTTLLTLIGCLRNLETGHAQLLGEELNGADNETLVMLRRRLGFIFQAHNLHESLTATQNVRMGLEVHGAGRSKYADKAARHILTLLGLEDRMDLSAGQSVRRAKTARRGCPGSGRQS